MSKSVQSDPYVSINVFDEKHELFNRLQTLQEFYCNEFGSKPNFFVRVPGRVNIIGEHVDYCGYPVLPMAIDQCILLAVGYTEENSFLQLRNLQSSKFPNYKCDLQSIKIELPEAGGPEWFKYYLCGVKGIYENNNETLKPIGMKIALSGNIPPASGLSSSSALVSAAALATAHVHRLPLERKILASISAQCERYIGTQGGGMDQAIAYLAQAGCAQFIEFHPELNATPICLPEGACFVVANSLAEINKAASSDFNERVVECRLSTRLIAKNMNFSNWSDLIRFAQLQEMLSCTLTELEAITNKYLPKNIYTREEICEELDISIDEFVNKFLTPNTRHMPKFKLRQRALHVIQESLRVARFRAICEQTNEANGTQHLNNGNLTNVCVTNDGACMQHLKKLAILSELMRKSHHSLQDLYECSHPDLDQLVAISDAANVGARLTGAGWGGCIVALCDSVEACEKYMRELKNKYYLQLPSHILEMHQHNDFNDVVFATFPRSGAEILHISDEINK
ncbi:N-acetylgalactosamine kinase-like [Teleopsis dalmanni]|uniref:N-acetylgalactosamine kinase-like n=1 Tax=Teleopsis dalmanni TaxID=139649 RepID=UPI0018CECDFB|nr:N-acetylgalactosamine kinase-like [Teleopsis dalmanni]XP_037933604.1 N-acetylgalactosamine kinase-like [Teleopsis dalmanni]